MTKAEQIAVDPVRQPTSLRHQFATLVRQHPQFLNLVRSHPRLAPQAVQAVLRELFRVQAIGLSADMAGVRRIDDRRPPSPGQAEGHVVLAGRLTGVTEVRWGQFDAMLLQSAQDPFLCGVQFGPHGRHVTLDLDDLRPVGNQHADLEESRVAVDTNAISVERKAWLSLPIGDGGGQQLSCRCWRCDTAHWTQPRRKTL